MTVSCCCCCSSSFGKKLKSLLSRSEEGLHFFLMSDVLFPPLMNFCLCVITSRPISSQVHNHWANQRLLSGTQWGQIHGAQREGVHLPPHPQGAGEGEHAWPRETRRSPTDQLILVLLIPSAAHDVRLLPLSGYVSLRVHPAAPPGDAGPSTTPDRAMLRPRVTLAMSSTLKQNHAILCRQFSRNWTKPNIGCLRKQTKNRIFSNGSHYCLSAGVSFTDSVEYRALKCSKHPAEWFMGVWCYQ